MASVLAEEIKRLKAAVDRATDKRGRLPQPLFWSLFNNAIDTIKKKKLARDLVKDVLNGQP